MVHIYTYIYIIFQFKNQQNPFCKINKFCEMFVLNQSEQQKTIANNFASLDEVPHIQFLSKIVCCGIGSQIT